MWFFLVLINFMGINFLMARFPLRWRNKYGYPHFMRKEVESVKGQLAADWLAIQDSNSRVAPRGPRHGPLARVLLKEKTNPGGLSETGLRITIR